MNCWVIFSYLAFSENIYLCQAKCEKKVVAILFSISDNNKHGFWTFILSFVF
jgi:hypothetical protein